MTANQIILSICIPTYNRAEYISKLIPSLPDHPRVEYIIIDDGSEINHQKIIRDTVNTSRLPLRLYEKANGGKISAFMFGVNHATGEYAMDLDDDDMLSARQLETILKDIKNSKSKGMDKLAGVYGLCVNTEGQIIGSPLPDQNVILPISRIYADFRVTGDKKPVLKKNVLLSVTLPEYNDETRMPSSALWFAVTANHPVMCFNHVYCTKRYLPIGLSHNLLYHRLKSPNSSRVPYRFIIVSPSGLIKNKMYRMKCLINYCRFGFHGAKPFVELSVLTRTWLSLGPAIVIGFLFYIRDLVYRTGKTG